MAKARKKVQASRKSARRKPASKKINARRAVKAKTRAGKPKQKFNVSHHREEDFDQGLRSYAKYRDLGMAAATGGMVQAHVIRFIPPYRAVPLARRNHALQFGVILSQNPLQEFVGSYRPA